MVWITISVKVYFLCLPGDAGGVVTGSFHLLPVGSFSLLLVPTGAYIATIVLNKPLKQIN